MHPYSTPALVAVEMGYGHLRPAWSLGRELGTPVLEADRPPLCDAEEQRTWGRVRSAYEWTSRASQLPLVGQPFRAVLDTVTEIGHLHPYRDLSAPDSGVRALQRLIHRGLGRGLVRYLEQHDVPLLTTFYAPAVIADQRTRVPVFCLITDSDCARIWAPPDPSQSRIHYLVPSHRARRRLEAYGVPLTRIHYTGFPLPPALLGGRDLPVARRLLAARLKRLDPKGRFLAEHASEVRHFLPELDAAAPDQPPRLTFAVGGAGAQADIATTALPSLAGLVRAGRLRLCLVAGVRAEVAARFDESLQAAGLLGHPGVELLHEPSLPKYFERFDAVLADTDVLWTKPSELTFYAALGLPIVFAPAVGVQEQYNRRWAREYGAGVKQREPAHAASWLQELLNDGTLASCAWAGFSRLPKFGTYQIADRVRAAVPS